MNSVYLYGVKEITQGFAGKIGTFLKSKKPARKQAFLCMAPLTGIAFASNWLIIKLNQKSPSVKTTRVTTNDTGDIKLV